MVITQWVSIGGRPAEKDAVLEPPPPPEAPLEAAESSDRRAASRSRSPKAPRGVLTGIWIDALYGAPQELAENSIEAALGIRDGFYVSQGRLLRRADQIMEAWKENKEARRSWRRRRRGRITSSGSATSVDRLPCDNMRGGRSDLVWLWMASQGGIHGAVGEQTVGWFEIAGCA